MLEYPAVVLRPREDFRLRQGHLWSFSNEIAQAPLDFPPGGLADLQGTGREFLARGFYHPHSLIAFRVLSARKEVIDEAFFLRRLQQALALRERLYPGTQAYRLVFGESDGLPGLLIDRYGDYLSMQIVSAGMERWKESLVRALSQLLKPKGIVGRPDSPMRVLEGLPEGEPEVLSGDLPERVQITLENGSYFADLLGGQKTGFYFDQRDNRQALASLCAGKRVLDAFCYSGAFGIAAARAGAREVVFIDSAQPALELAEANARLNHVGDRCVFVKGDALKLLASGPAAGAFDVISIDPPAYARSRKHIPVALKAYEKLNALAMGALSSDGILASSSCSHHVTRDLFASVLRRAALKAQRSVKLLEFRSQAKDHPVLLAMPETDYLKCAILQVG